MEAEHGAAAPQPPSVHAAKPLCIAPSLIGFASISHSINFQIHAFVSVIIPLK